MKKSAVSSAVSVLIGQTALQSLSAAIGNDKHAKHAFIVATVSTIIALALCKAPPKGFGNPADHTKLAETFAAAKMKNYAEHCAAFPQALKGRMRSIDAWEEAQEEGAIIVLAAFAGCAPKVYTAEQLTAREEKKAKAAKERAKNDKADAKAAKDLAKAELEAEYQRGYEAGRASMMADMPVVNAAMVADLIRSGAFRLEDIASAMGLEVVEAVGAEVVTQ